MSTSTSTSIEKMPTKNKILFDQASTALIASIFISSEVGMVLFIIAYAFPYGILRFIAMGLATLGTLYFFIRFTIKIYLAEVALAINEDINAET